MQEYCLLAKGSKGRMLVDIIQRATSDPTLFAFGELLVVPSIEQVDRRLLLRLSRCYQLHSNTWLLQLRGTDLEAAYRLLKLFAYGTWTSYLGLTRRLLYHSIALLVSNVWFCFCHRTTRSVRPSECRTAAETTATNSGINGRTQQSKCSVNSAYC